MVVIGFLKEDCKVLEVRDDRQGKPCVVGLMPSIVPLQVDQVVVGPTSLFVVLIWWHLC